MPRWACRRGPCQERSFSTAVYLDGELSPADGVRIAQSVAADPKLGTRPDLMMKRARPFPEAFEPILTQAPAERLDAMLDAMLHRPRDPPGASCRSSAGTLGPRVDADADRRRAVAQDLSLYTTETLSIIPEGTAQRQELATLGRKLGIGLTDTQVSLPNLRLKRSKMLDYDGRTLGFLAYLDPASGSLALRIMDGLDGDSMPRVEKRRGMNVVYWSHNHHGFTVIGRAGAARLQALAATSADRFGTAGPPGRAKSGLTGRTRVRQGSDGRKILADRWNARDPPPFRANGYISSARRPERALTRAGGRRIDPDSGCQSALALWSGV